MTCYGLIGLGRVGSLIATKLTAGQHDVCWISPGIQRAPVDAGKPSTIDEVRACDVVIECVDEMRDTKIAVLRQLAGSSAAVLTTTSSFEVADLAKESGLGTRLAGFHFLPSYGGELAELTTQASDVDVRASAITLAETLDLSWMEVADRPGRISRRLLVPFIENVLRAVDLKIASPEDIDRVVELGLGHSVGPLHRLTAAGLDDHRAAAEALRTTIPTPTTDNASPE
jgi:3-hydroxybutyryl-CoA dehydrogenase